MTVTWFLNLALTSSQSGIAVRCVLMVGMLLWEVSLKETPKLGLEAWVEVCSKESREKGKWRHLSTKRG